ncbi:hypothetical protein GLOTRDRAFT_110365 [Gloeophyllum trabeum ATCC 11539]|uniref:Uncharacterized protein n=1 Tax=Gloeophyllum trabeum (strain ATCC 11539 / FP-39264 / Madison 617) TaxID=670483 RepID=S7QAM1_GLOTA|nr:uncharacterized protein GLOTRDRAFT_110365 [Gloeophyllum trabeum ATCC 11539]EPQ56966.1 hypothetical protein GLOTRDRAFT_110365 [Gloeophyllum trabeum ATCC 11539]
MDWDNPHHDDFIVVSRETGFGGYEALKPKGADIPNTQFFRKAISPGNRAELEDALALQENKLANVTFGTVYPIYAHEGRKWILISISDHESDNRSTIRES